MPPRLGLTAVLALAAAITAAVSTQAQAPAAEVHRSISVGDFLYERRSRTEDVLFTDAAFLKVSLRGMRLDAVEGPAAPAKLAKVKRRRR